MASIIKVDTIQTAAGGTPTAADLGINTTGTVLQVVSETYQTETNNTSNTWTDMLTASITPSSTSSDILVIGQVGGVLVYGGSGNDRYGGIRLLRDSTAISSQVTRGGRNSGSTGADMGLTSAAIAELDSPSTTSSTTYKIQTRQFNGQGTIRVCDATSLGTGKISLTLIEIAG